MNDQSQADYEEDYLAMLAEDSEKRERERTANLQTDATPDDGPRTFREILASATALKPDDIADVSAIVNECAALSPIERDAVFRAIKNATNIALGTLRAQLSQGSEENPAPDHLELARHVIEHKGGGNMLCAEAHVWGWQEAGVWAKLDERAIKQDVQGALDRAQLVDVTASIVNGVADVLKTEIFVQGHAFNIGNPETVNCRNGQVELAGGQWTLKPHCREEYRTTQVPVAFDPEATAPQFEAFLRQVFRDDDDRDAKRQALLELIGYPPLTPLPIRTHMISGGSEGITREVAKGVTPDSMARIIRQQHAACLTDGNWPLAGKVTRARVSRSGVALDVVDELPDPMAVTMA